MIDHLDDGLAALSAAVCDEHRVSVHKDVQLGWHAPTTILLESPSSLRAGVYDIDFVGAYTYLGGRDTLMLHIGSIGRFCSIASNIVAGQVEHPTDFLSPSPVFNGAVFSESTAAFRERNQGMFTKAARSEARAMAHRSDKIVIGNDVWIAEGAFIRRGVTIGNGAIIAARAVVTKDVPPYAIVGGSPARIIRYRFEPEVIAELQELQWWNYGLSALHGVDFTDIHQATAKIRENIESGVAEVYNEPIVKLSETGVASAWRYHPEIGALVPM